MGQADMIDIGTLVVSPFGVAALLLLTIGVAGLTGGGRLRKPLSLVGIGGFAVLAAVAVVVAPKAPAGPAEEPAGEPRVAELLADERVVAERPAEPLVAEAPPTTPEQTADRLRAEALVAEAREHYNGGRTDEARRVYGEAEALFDGLGDVGGLASVAFGIGVLEGALGQSDAARAALARARDLYGEASDPQAEADVLMAIGDLEKTTLQFDAARVAYAEGRAAFAGSEGAGGSHVLLGLEELAAMPEGEEAARRALDEAKLLYEQIEDLDGVGLVGLVTAELERGVGNAPRAYSEYVDAITLLGFGEDSQHLAEANLGLANLELSRGYAGSARLAFAAAQANYRVIGDVVGAAEAMVGLGHLERLLGRYDTAGLDFGSAARLYGGARDFAGFATATLGRANASRLGGHFSDARPQLNDAFGMFERTGDPAGMAAVWMGRGYMDVGVGAREAFTAARDLYREIGDRRGEGVAALSLARFQVGRDRQAAAATAAEARQAFADAGVPLGEAWALAELAGIEEAGAQAARDEANAILAGIADPLEAANRLLGLAEFGQFSVHDAEVADNINDDVPDAPPGPAAPPPAGVAAEEVAEEATDPLADFLAEYPGANGEAHTLLERIAGLLEAA